jgi:hypothetical protein
MADEGSQQRKPNLRTTVEDVKAIATVFIIEAESVLGRRAAWFLGGLVLFAVVFGGLLALLDCSCSVISLTLIGNGLALITLTWKTLYDLWWDRRRFRSDIDSEMRAARQRGEPPDRTNAIVKARRRRQDRIIHTTAITFALLAVSYLLFIFQEAFK